MKILHADLKKRYSVSDSTFPMHRNKEDWWKERWLAKDSEIRNSKDAKVVFLGDSITQAWEDEGKPAWDKHFAP